ncbi:MFS transporter [Streptomyces sp. SP2-10]|uniref:MFS transporter n=1 Tax=Streptomyces sp. SP2-10 TaxID=2873385 RepID=UPI001CA6B646|nr:MFS transporter [Streptomyces sp. SP2-10]MBY8845343.1 MFS transporter [Streptomyces sp. SP2-10]
MPNRILLLALSLGAFSIGTDGFVISGLLDRIARDFDVTTSVAGQLVTVFALLYAISAPILAAMTAKVRRKQLLVAALIAFVASNLLGAVAPTYEVLMVARVLAAFGAALYIPCGIAVTVSVTTEEWRGRAIALVAGGMSAATALGVPIGTLVGAIGSWRITLVLVAAMALLATIVLMMALPEVPTPPSVTIRERLGVAAHPRVLAALLSNALACAGVFTMFTYIAPLAMKTTKVDSSGVSVFLLVWGVAAVAGSAVGGRAADRWGGDRAYFGSAAVLTVGLLVLALFTLPTPSGSWAGRGLFGLILAVISVSCWSLPTGQNHRIASLDIPAPTVALSLNSSSTYLGIAAGGALGGVATGSGSMTALTLTATGIEVLAVIVLAVAAALFARKRAADPQSAQPDLSATN